MANESIIYEESFSANDNMSSDQYKLVKLSGTDEVDTCDNASDAPIGVLLNKPAAAGRAARVQLAGVAKVVSDGNAAAIAAGDPLKTNASGQAVKADTDKQRIIGRALEASTTAGAVISMLIEPGYLAV